MKLSPANQAKEARGLDMPVQIAMHATKAAFHAGRVAVPAVAKAAQVVVQAVPTIIVIAPAAAQATVNAGTVMVTALLTAIGMKTGEKIVDASFNAVSGHRAITPEKPKRIKVDAAE